MKNGPSVLLKNQASGSKQNAFSATLKEGYSETRLQVAHLLRDAGLGNAKPIRGPAKTASLGHGQEVAEVTNF